MLSSSFLFSKNLLCLRIALMSWWFYTSLSFFSLSLDKNSNCSRSRSKKAANEEGEGNPAQQVFVLSSMTELCIFVDCSMPKHHSERIPSHCFAISAGHQTRYEDSHGTISTFRRHPKGKGEFPEDTSPNCLGNFGVSDFIFHLSRQEKRAIDHNFTNETV